MPADTFGRDGGVLEEQRSPGQRDAVALAAERGDELAQSDASPATSLA
jgi:hypothetical protein